MAREDPGEAVTLVFHDAPLRSVLEQITAQSGVRFVFASAAVDSASITCDLLALALNDALKHVLNNTTLTFKRLDERRFAIYPRPIGKSDIAGRVVDAQSGESLPYANILVHQSTSGVAANSEGYFLIRNVRSWPCTLEVEYIGYRRKRVIVAEDRDSTDLQVRLQQANIEMPGETIRAANWQAIQVGKEVGNIAISPSEFADLPMLGDLDISRSLQLMPGIRNSGYSGSGLHIRGGRPSQNLVLLDGMTLYHTDHSFGFFSAFNAQAIKDVRVFKSGLPARYGGRTSGVMELTGKTGDFHRPQLSISSSLMSTQGIAGIPLGGRGALFISARKSITRSILGTLHERMFRTLISDINPFHAVDDTPFTESESSGDIGFYDGLAKLTLTPSDNDILTMSFYQGRDLVGSVDDYGSANFWRKDDTIGTTDDVVEQESRWGSRGFSGQWHHQSRYFQITAQASYSDYFTRFELSEKLGLLFGNDALVDPTIPNFSNVKNNVTDKTVRLDGKWLAGDRHTVDVGAAYTRSAISLDSDGYILENEILEADTFRFKEDADLTVFYAEDTWQYSPELQLKVGLRSNFYAPNNGYAEDIRVDWEPRFSFWYQMTEHWTMKGNWGRFHQYIMQYDNDTPYLDGRISWILADNEFVKPGFSEHRTIGWQYQRGRFLLDFELYEKRVEGVFTPFDYRQFQSRNSLLNPLQQRNGYLRGFDIHVRHRLGRLNAWLSYGYNRAEVTVDNHYRPMDQDLPHDLKLVANYDLKHWNLSATWQLMSGRPYNVPELQLARGYGSQWFVLLEPIVANTGRLPAVHHLDLSLTSTFRNSFFRGKIGISVYNVYNRDNTWYRYFTVRNRAVKANDVRMFGVTPSLFLELSY